MLQLNHRNASLVHSHIAVLQFAFFLFAHLNVFFTPLRRCWFVRKKVKSCSRLKYSFPKGVSFVDFIRILAMYVEDLFDLLLRH